MSRKILISLSVIGVVAVIVIGVTISYFSDTETSVGNKFAVGKLDLKVDNTCHYNGAECICVTNSDSPYYGNCYWDIGGNGQFGDGEVSEDNQCYCSWQEKDLEQNDLFFNFNDVKPGDNGEDTVSLHVVNNNAWLCAQISNLTSDDNGCDGPESKIDTTCGEGEGDLQDNLFFTVWRDDDCDNVLDSGEAVLVDHQPASEGLWPLADSTNGSPIPGDVTICYGVKWEVPISASNIIQSDSLEGDISFTAVQARHMDDFKCSDLTGGGSNPECVQDTDCNDGNPCTNDTCESGKCVYSSINGISCDDGNPCTINDTCSNGQCAGTPKSCDDGNFCTADSCDAITGECIHQCKKGAMCNDEDPNTINDTCQLVGEECQCKGETPECLSSADCDDDNPCTDDICQHYHCQHTNYGFDHLCNDTPKCSAGIGNDKYGTGGDYLCKGYCDWHGHCDYAGDCQLCDAPNASASCHPQGDSGYCSIDSCNSGYADCDGRFGNGCEVLLDNNNGDCITAVSLDDSLCGDIPNNCIPADGLESNKGEGWYKVYLKECNASYSPLKIKAVLTVPSDVDYDLYLYSRCGILLASSENHSLGADETVTYTKTDNTSSNDSQWFYLEVRYHSGSSCDNWQLQVSGGSTCF